MNNCPHCDHELSPSEIGKLYAGLRKKHGAGSGRPKLRTCCKCEGPIRAHIYQSNEDGTAQHLNACPA
jgi:hypothetical protein